MADIIKLNPPPRHGLDVSIKQLPTTPYSINGIIPRSFKTQPKKKSPQNVISFPPKSPAK